MRYNSLIFCALCAVVLFSCGKIPKGIPASQDPLVFNVAADKLETKTVHTAMTGRYDENEKFVAYAAFAENSFNVSDHNSYTYFWNNNSPTEICSHNSNYYAWAPAAPYYWPLIGTLTFQAYSPADLGANSAPSFNWADWSEGFTFTNFQIPGVGDQYDLMYSERVENCRRSDYTRNAQAYDDDSDQTGGFAYNGINIAFKHALCLAEIQAVSSLGSNSSVKFRVKNVCLVNAYDTGTFTQTGESWTIDTGHTANYNLLGTDVWKDPLPGANDYETEFPVAPALILLPQELGRPVGQEVSISLTYEKYEGTTLLEGPTTVTWQLPLIYTEKDSGGTPVVTTGWQRERKYTYRFIFSDYIEFEARISPWQEATRGHYVIVQ